MPVDLRQEVKNAIIEREPKTFLADYIYDRIPYIFDGDRSAFISWKRAFADAIGIDPYAILFVGSAAVGVSLNPYKNLRPFSADSDVDLAIISNYYFTVSWQFLRENSHLRLHQDPKLRSAWDDHVNRLIYWGTIATDKLLGLFPYGMKWVKAVDTMSRKEPTFGRKINLRVYSDYESLRAYQINAVKDLRETLLKEGK